MALRNAGITNVAFDIRKTKSKSQNLKVAEVMIDNVQYVSGGCFVKKSSDIQLVYYKLSATIGEKSSDITENTEDKYISVLKSLQDKGFTNITVLRNDSLILGWSTKEGSIEKISVNGQTEFSASSSFDYDVPIIIEVNTFKNRYYEGIKD